MNNYEFSINESIKFGWNTTKKHFPFLIGILVLYVAVHIILRLFSSSFSISTILITSRLFEPTSISRFFVMSILLLIAFLIVIFFNVLLRTGLLKIMINFVSKEKSTTSTLFSQYKIFTKFLGGMILYILVIFGGLLLLIIPGIIWAIKYFFFSYFIVDQKLSPYEALKRSSSITKNQKWNVFKLIILSILINMLGAIFLGIGLLFTIPITKLAFAHAYKQLLVVEKRRKTEERRIAREERLLHASVKNKSSKKKLAKKKAVKKKKPVKKKVAKKTSKKRRK